MNLQNYNELRQGLKIAVYSGAVPSTTFIERLIEGLAINGNKVFLFGVEKKWNKPIEHVYKFTYRESLFNKIFQLLKYSFLLSLFKPEDKNRLDAIISQKKTNARLLKVKYYPVLYHKPDIFHLQWAKSLDDWVWVKAFGIKLMVSLRGAHINYSPIADVNLATIYRQQFPKVDRFHAVSETIAIEATKYGAVLNKIDVVYSGLPIPEFIYTSKVSNGKLAILSIGRSHWIKGYVHALDAMAILKNEQINFSYNIVGVDETEELLFQRAQLDLEHDVQFLGALPFEQVKSKIQKADILLLSSIEEGIANVVLEAMALGTLVVSSDCGGMSEVIRDGENGFLTPVRDPLKMALTLQRVAKLDLEAYNTITKKARETIEQHHNLKDTALTMQNLYNYVLNE